MMRQEIQKIFGIDLGTTYSCISFVDEHGRPVVIPNKENERITPSVVFFDGDSVIVGEIAKDNAKLSPKEVVSFVKRDMGNPHFIFEYNNSSYSPEEISSYILRKLVGDAEQNLGEKITDVVITIPAYFGINEREATRRSGEIAGLNVRSIINEPTAAAITYGMAENNKEKVVLVYDLGGGTFDITMIEIKPESIQVICTGGDHDLGGKNWDDSLTAYLVEKFQEETGTVEDILEDAETCQELQGISEKTKKTLSERKKAPLSITHGGEKVKVEVTKEKFEEITKDLVERTISLTHEMLEEAKKKGYTTFDEILLVGGSTRMPQISDRVKAEFLKDPIIFDPDEAVAKGAALFGWKLAVNDELIKRIANATGETTEELQEKGTSDIKPEIVAKAMEDLANHTGLTLSAVKSSTIEIKNVTSKSFGVVAIDKNETELVFNLTMKNSTVPACSKENFGTYQSNQETVNIRIMENEVTDETLDPGNANEIGNAVLTLPCGLPAGSPIEITFKLNEEGRLDLKAVEKTDNRVIESSFETNSVIKGEALKEAKARSSSMKVS
jgi:molecular chaperone DnaK (HSP70)